MELGAVQLRAAWEIGRKLSSAQGDRLLGDIFCQTQKKADRNQEFSPAAGVPTEMCTHVIHSDKLLRPHCCLGKVISSKHDPHSFQLHAATLVRDHNPNLPCTPQGKLSHPFSTFQSSSRNEIKQRFFFFQSCPFYSPLLRGGFPAPEGKLYLIKQSSQLLGSHTVRSRWSMLCPGFPPTQI